jgi:hypothetical protein
VPRTVPSQGGRLSRIDCALSQRRGCTVSVHLDLRNAQRCSTRKTLPVLHTQRPVHAGAIMHQGCCETAHHVFNHPPKPGTWRADLRFSLRNLSLGELGSPLASIHLSCFSSAPTPSACTSSDLCQLRSPGSFGLTCCVWMSLEALIKHFCVLHILCCPENVRCAVPTSDCRSAALQLLGTPLHFLAAAYAVLPCFLPWPWRLRCFS